MSKANNKMKMWSNNIVRLSKQKRDGRKARSTNATLATTKRSSSCDKTAGLWYTLYSSAPNPPWGNQSAGAKLTASAQFKPIHANQNTWNIKQNCDNNVEM